MKILKNKAVINAHDVGNYSIYCNDSLTNVSLPKLESVGDDFMPHNDSLTNVSLPKLVCSNETIKN